MKPTVGRKVHFYFEHDLAHLLGGRDTSRLDGPIDATVVAVNKDGAVALALLLPPIYRPNYRGTWAGVVTLEGRDSVPYSDDPTPGCWTWPPRV